MECNTCKTTKAWWIKSATNNTTGEKYERCSECAPHERAPSVNLPEHKRPRPKRQPSAAAFHRTQKERDQIVNHMVKAGSSQVDQFAIMSNDGRGNVIREEVTKTGHVVEKKVVGRTKK